MSIEIKAQTEYYPKLEAEIIANELQTDGYIVSLRKELNGERFKVVARKLIRIDLAAKAA